MNKHFSSRAVFLLLTIPFLLACGSISSLVPGRVNGSGNIESQSYELGEFTEVVIGGIGHVNLTQGDQTALTITADDNFFEHIIVETENDTLTIRIEPNTLLTSDHTIQYDLTVTDLSAFDLLGSADMTASQLSADTLSLSIAGSGSIEIGDLETNSLELEIAGSGGMDLTGTATNQTIDISGSGDINSPELESETTTVVIAGSGDVVVWATETLDIEILGAGDVGYVGSPTVSQNIAGSGSVEAYSGE